MARRCASVAIVLLAGCAWPVQSFARLSPQRAAKVRAALSREIRRDPGAITQRWFLRKAGLVQFKLPVTLRLRPVPAPSATVDLGASLGSRGIALGGSLAADVVFSDAFDGGALGNVGIEFRQSDAAFLTSSSIPLLWNPDVSDPATGCGGFAGGVDAIETLMSGDRAGDDDWLGPSRQPFPAASAPGGFEQPPDVQDTVLRTNALRLQVADRGTAASGGHANLFGNIPGRNVSVDVTLSLTTVINAIVRVVDDDSSAFACRQLWTGAVQNTIPGLHLEGQLRIAPALTPDGHLRIAKVTVSSPPATPARVALGACLLPVSAYADGAGERSPAPNGRPCGSPSDAEIGLAALNADAGAKVTVAGDISVDQVSVDVIIGDV